MTELITRTARLVPYARRPKQVPGFVTARTFEPEADDPTAVHGSLFIVAEVLVSGRPSEDLIDLISDTFSERYYSEDDDTAEALPRFEAAIKAVNTALSDYVNQGNAAWIGKLSAIIAVSAGQELHLTHTGSAEAYLYRQQAATRITADSAARPAGPSKTFGSIASGQLEPSDRLLLATPALIHQLSLQKLHDTIISSSPNAAIAEFTQLLHDTDSTRVACLVIELTTPELAALQVRSEQPSEIRLGAPETPLAAAKMAATPLAHATVTTGRRAGKAARLGWRKAQPQVRRAGLGAASAVRAMISGERVARYALVGIGVLALLVVLLAWHASAGRASSKLVSQYTNDYNRYRTALTISGAAQQSQLNTLQQDVAALNPQQRKLDAALKHAKLPTDAPRTLAGLAAAITTTLDQLNGVVTVSPTTVVTLSEFKNVKPIATELTKGNLYVVDANNKSAIYVVDLTTKSVRKTSADTSKLGSVVSTTLSSTGDGMYLLTSSPEVWFYRFGSDTLTQITLGLSSWEPGQSIASYAGNLYVLSGTTVNKHVSTSTGFAPAQAYLSGGSWGSSPFSLMVDGYIYVAASDGLHQLLSGTAKATLPVRSGLDHLDTLRATTGDNIIGVDRATGRIGLWNDTAALAYIRQYRPSGVTSLGDAVMDATSGRIYVASGDKILSFDAGL